MTEILFRLPGEDERAVRLAAIIQGMANALQAWEDRSTWGASVARRMMALTSCPVQMNLRSGNRQGTNDPRAFAAIFLPTCERIHQAMYSSLESDPEMFHKIVDGERGLLGAKLAAVGLASLPTVENTPDNEPITFSWPDAVSEDRARVS